MTTFEQNYDSYVNLSSSKLFKKTIATDLQSILNVYADEADSVTILYSMMGMVQSEQQVTNDNKPGVTNITPNFSIFFNFWNTETNIDPVRELLQGYLLGPHPNSTIIANFQTINNIATYILSILFSVPQYDTNGNATSFLANLLDTKQNQPAVVNVKNFLQSIVSSSFNNLLGAGNYQITETSPSTNTNEITTNSALTPNSGFISILCGHQFDLYQKKNENLTGEKLINSFRHLISQTNSLLGFCGCFAPVPPYFQNIKGFSDEPGDSPCDFLCYNNKSFKLYENSQNPDGTLEGGGTQIGCKDNVCVIDNTLINSMDSNGSVNFNQTCKGCEYPGSGCICYIDVSNQQLINKITSGKNGMMTQQHFKQKCSGDSICFQYNEGEITEVKCNEINTPLTGSLFSLFENGATRITSPEYIPDFFWLIVIFIFFLLILFIYQILDY